MRLTADQINIAWLESADVDSLKAAMRVGGEVLSAVNALLQTPEGKKIAFEMMNDPDYVPRSRRQPDPEEAAQIAEDEARATAAAEVEAQASAAQLVEATVAQQAVDHEAIAAKNGVEDAEARKIGATIVRGASGEIEKIVVDYQVRNDEGRPVGRATHFEGRTWIEVAGKLIAAHANAVTYGERVKSNRFKQSAAALESTERSATAKNIQAESERLATEAVNEKDPVKMQEAVRKAASAEREAHIADEAYKAHGKIIAETWMADHTNDFFVCQASISIIGDYMKANNLPMSYDNLEKTFQAVKHQLPPVPTEGQQDSATVVPTSVAAPINPTPATAAATVVPPPSIPATAAVTPVTETQSQSTVAPPAATTAQASTPATANQPTVARRPAVNGGLQPGSMSAARPSASSTQQAPQETRSQLLREIGRMEPAMFRKKLRTEKNYREKLIAAGIPVVGQYA